ncbi:unnamed protein product [Rotaria sp. Silwood1]|nr:unnamed protein product [Rotaria sp. Silwood1]
MTPKTLISLCHDRQASLAEILQIVGLRLDLHDYTGYNLPKESFKIFQFYSLNTSIQTIKLGDSLLPILLYDMNTSINSINEQLVEKRTCNT